MIVFLRRVGMAFVGQGGQAASSFLLTVVVSRAVVPSIRGEFVLLTLIPQIGAFLATLGLPGAVMRAAAGEPEERPALLGVSAIASLVAGLLLAALTPAVMTLTHSETPSMLLILAGTVSLVWLVFAAWFTFGCERFILAGVIRTVPILGTVLGIVIVDARGQADLVTMFAPWAGLHLLVAVITAIYLVRRHGIEWPGRQRTARWINYGLRYSTVQILNLVTLRLDQILLGWLGTTAAVGLYSIGVSLSEGLLLATTAVGLVVFIDSAKGERATRFRRKLVLTVLASCAAAGALALVATPLVALLFGDRYEAAAELTRILVVGTPGLVITRLVTNRLAGTGRPGTASIYALVTLGVTVILDVILIPSHGAMGAAWASAVGYNAGGATALLTLRWASRRTAADAPPTPPLTSPAAELEPR